MSRLKELIDELCPDGVERLPLEKVAPIVRESVEVGTLGNDEFVGVQELLQNKEGVQNDLPPLPKDGKAHRFQPGDTLIGNIRPYLKKIWLADREGGTSGDVIVVRPGDGVDATYIYFILSSDSFFEYDMNHSKGSKMPRGERSAIGKYPVPVPPIEVQQEIVRVLDAMQELDGALSEELNARKRQYNDLKYRLITQQITDGRETTLGDFIEMRAGKNIKASQLVDVKDEDHPYPCYGGNGLRGYIGFSSHNGQHVLIGRQGALCGNVKLVDGEYYATEHAVVCTPKQPTDEYWLYCFLGYMNLNQYKTQSAQPGLSVQALTNIRISIPSYESQRFVSERLLVIDNLIHCIDDDICARRKQFEYYRDKLLDFPEKAVL